MRHQMKTFTRLIHAGFEYQIVVFRIDGGSMIAQGRNSREISVPEKGILHPI